MDKLLAAVFMPVIILGLIGSLVTCGSNGADDRPTVSAYSDHAEWSRQMRVIETKKFKRDHHED